MTATAAPSAPGTPGAPQGAPAALPATKPRGMFLRGLEVFLENKLAVIGVVLLAAIFIFCFIGPYFYHSNQVTVNLANENLPPGPGNPLGTDQNLASGLTEVGLLNFFAAYCNGGQDKNEECGKALRTRNHRGYSLMVSRSSTSTFWSSRTERPKPA